MIDVYHDKNTDLSILDGDRISVIGYGNQGRIQATDMRDSGLEVIVGNIRESNFTQAEEDRLPTYPNAKAVKRGTKK